MSRTAMTLTIYRCPEESVRAVLDVLGDHWDEAANDLSDGVVLGSGYIATGVYGDRSEELAASLEHAAPEVWFDVYTDPTSEYLGVGLARVNGRTVPYEAGPEGAPMFSLAELLPFTDKPGLAQHLAVATFGAISEEAHQLGELDEADRLVRPSVCPTCDERKRCTCEEDLEDEAHAMNDAFDRLPALT